MADVFTEIFTVLVTRLEISRHLKPLTVVLAREPNKQRYSLVWGLEAFTRLPPSGLSWI